MPRATSTPRPRPTPAATPTPKRAPRPTPRPTPERRARDHSDPLVPKTSKPTPTPEEQEDEQEKHPGEIPSGSRAGKPRLNPPRRQSRRPLRNQRRLQKPTPADKPKDTEKPSAPIVVEKSGKAERRGLHSPPPPKRGWSIFGGGPKYTYLTASVRAAIDTREGQERPLEIYRRSQQRHPAGKRPRV